MNWLQDGAVWFAALFVVFAGAWLRNLLSAVVPSPQRAILALKNLAAPKPSQDRVGFVLAWLANDPNGNNANAVSATFTEIEGIELCRSARIVSASGAADAWRPAMRRETKRLLSTWHADIAIVGRVDRDGDALTLWFVTATDDDTLADTSNNTYVLNLNRLPDNFLDHLRVQIRALVLTLALPKTSNNARHIGLRQLAATVPKLENLFLTLSAPADRSSLCMIYVLAQSSLGEWLGQNDRLRSAIERAREVVDAPHNGPDANALLTIRVNLARTLYLLGERQADIKLLEEAVSLLNDALGESRDPDRESIDAGIRGLAANALRALVHLQPNPEHLDLAAGLLESALEVHRRDEDAPLVAITQNNLGLVCLDLAQATRRRDAVERALSLFDAASPVAKQSAMPTLCAMTQNNAGQAHELLAELDPGSAVAELELSRDRYEQAVRGYSDSTTPYHSASSKTSLARVLTKLGASTGSVECLDRAITLLHDAHDAGTKRAGTTGGAGATLAGLGTALLTRGKLRDSLRDIADAVPWLERALDAYPLHSDPLNWVKIKTNLANCHFALAQTGKDVERIRTGFSVLEEVFLHSDLAAVLARSPELYLAFLQGTDLLSSLDPDPGFVRDWIATWIPLFADREHRGVPSFVLVTVQNSIVVVCQDHGALADAIRLCRYTLARLHANDAANRDAPEHRRTSLPPLLDSADINADLRLTTKRNLATALRMSGEETACAPHLREAIQLLEEVLAAQDAAVDPMEWAITQSGRARTYKELYLVEGDTEVLRVSLSAYDQTIAALPEGMDSPWHQQVPGKREVVKDMLNQATKPRDASP